MTAEEHNKYLAYSFFAYSGFQAFWMILIAIWFLFIFSTIPGDPGAGVFFGIFFAVMFVFQLIFTAPAVVAGYGLLKHKKWARVASIVGGIMSAMSVPIGTATCVYAMWFFLGGPGKEMYEDIDRSTGSSTLGLNAPPVNTWEDQPYENEYVRPPQPSDWR